MTLAAAASAAPALRPIETTHEQRHVEAALRFAVGGGRTVLTAQHVPYPFHVTRPFYLDDSRSGLATLYLQSASGGIYRGDRLALTIEVGRGAAAHVTTQAATIVHDTRESPAEQVTRIVVARDAVALLTPEPLLLFPGADVTSRTEVVLSAGATLIATDGFACHDPAGEGRAFARHAMASVVHGETGLLLSDRGSIDGAAFAGNASPLGPYRAAGTLLVLGRNAYRLDPAAVEARIGPTGCLAGLSRAPNEAGFAGRILARDGGALRQGLEEAFAVVVESVLGFVPARRRK
jgi:urease accessory protein